MKPFATLALAASLCSWGMTAQSADLPPDETAGKPDKTERDNPGLALGHLKRPDHAGRPEHPAHPNRPPVPNDVKELIEKAKLAREAFLTEQKALVSEIKGATQEERVTIREALADNREKFLADQKELREQVRDRLKEIRQEFKDNRDKVIDEARKNGPRKRPGAED